MSADIKREWGNIKPYHHYAVLNDVKHGYSFGCFFSVGDDYQEQKKIVLGIANLSLNIYNVITLSSKGNVELVDGMSKVVKKLFPLLTFDGYRDLIFDMLDESVAPVLIKYEKGFPSGFKVLDTGNLNVIEDVGATPLSYSVSLEDVKFNYKMVSIIEDILQKEEVS